MATATTTFLFSVWGHPRIPRMDTSEKATMVREPGNKHDRFAVAVLEDEMLCTVGHLLQEITRIAFIGVF